MILRLAKAVVGETRCRMFDWQHNVRTCGDVSLDGVTVMGESAAHGTPYVPSHPKFVLEVLRRLEIDYPQYVFVDLGSGKGRVILIASQFPFRQIIGVEFAQELHKSASENIRRYRGSQRCRDVQSLNRDAMDFDFPAQPTVVFLFNPFRPPVLVPVLRHLEESLERHPRDVLLLYSGSFHGDLVERETRLRCVDRSEYHNLYRVPLEGRAQGTSAAPT